LLEGEVGSLRFFTAGTPRRHDDWSSGDEEWDEKDRRAG